MTFKDHFSGVAQAYAQARPEYPDSLFDLLAAHVPASAQVWEPGCGSGQATRGLAARFAHVHATDPSPQQIAQHWAHGAENVTVAVEPGERTALADASVGLVAVAQALHWFDRDEFIRECDRVLAPGGVLAAWGYGDCIAPDGMEAEVEAFLAEVRGDWPPERRFIDERYDGFDWPFEALPVPAMWLTVQWPLARLLGYLASYSSVSRHRQRTGRDAVAEHTPALRAAWGDPASVRTIRWPLFLHMRKKH